MHAIFSVEDPASPAPAGTSDSVIMRACIEDDRMEIERAFLDELANVSTFEIKDGKLYLKKGDSVLLILIGKDK